MLRICSYEHSHRLYFSYAEYTHVWENYVFRTNQFVYVQTDQTNEKIIYVNWNILMVHNYDAENCSSSGVVIKICFHGSTLQYEWNDPIMCA